MATAKLKDTICEAAIIGLSFNNDYSEAVFSPNNNLLHIVNCKEKKDCTKWEIQNTLEQHDQSVSAISWHGKTNRILSCAQDRTAFVWNCNLKGKWKPQIVMLDAGVKRGLTSCAWSNSGSKIYVGSAAANIAVGKFDAEDEWWICRLIELHKSTITSLAPHPLEDSILASGGTDGKVMIVSTYIKKLDDKKLESFGHIYFEKEFGAWIHAIAWSPSGKNMAVATHDSRVHIFDLSNTDNFNKENIIMHTITLSTLPLKSLAFVVEDHLIGGGFDYYPILFTPNNNNNNNNKSKGWKMSGKWIMNRTTEVKTTQQLAREKFQNEARIGQAEVLDEEETRHKNTITTVVSLLNNSNSNNAPGMDDPIFATASLDGRVEVWTMGEVTSVS